MAEKKIQTEEEFHDKWAENEKVENIDVNLVNEAPTAPEMRWIFQKLGNISGKKVLDVGCGLGEASVYFAKKGGIVTSLDLSQGMLDTTKKLAKVNQVDVKIHLGTSEKFNFSNNEKFDIIYVGNCFHHSEIDKSINEIKKHLSKDGILVSWDPMAYNPIINIYRKIATKVRTIDEHPLTLKDLRLFKKNFSNIEIEYFWFTTLLIFCLMFVFQRKNPNKERYWKSIIYDHKKWLWLYYPLEKLDKLILTIFPFLKFLCWNVAIFAREN